MNKLKPRNKICFQNNNNPHAYLKLKKLKKKKWNLFKRKLFFKKEIKPEKRNRFFQKRLFEIQQLKNFYGSLSEKKIKNLYKKNLKKNKNIKTIENFLGSLESRLDICLVRLKLAKTIYHSRQLINHKKIKINNKIINKPGIYLKEGDIITPNENKK